MAATPNALKVAYEHVTGKDADANSPDFATWKSAWNDLQLSHQSPAVGALVVSYAVYYGVAWAQTMLTENAAAGADKYWRLSMWYGNLRGADSHRAFEWMKAYSGLSMAVPKSK